MWAGWGVGSAEEAGGGGEELHQPSILRAGSAMAILRGAVGFVVFFAAFTFKRDLFAFGVVVSAQGFGNFTGNLLAPRIREHLREEWMLAGALLGCAASAFFGLLIGATVGLGIAALAIGF